jgi:hypothetical protein
MIAGINLWRVCAILMSNHLVCGKIAPDKFKRKETVSHPDKEKARRCRAF